MTSVLALLALCLAQVSEAGRAPLDHGATRGVAIASDDTFWLGDRDGRLFRSGDGGRSWSEVEVPQFVERDPEAIHQYTYTTLDEIHFFDAEHAFVPGGLGQGVNQVLVTEDAGETWEAIPLPFRFYADASGISSNGRAWMAERTGRMIVSEDRGRTWTWWPEPEFVEQQSVQAGHLEGSTGVLGYRRNLLRWTVDAGKSWVDVPTPADQLFDEVYDGEHPDRARDGADIHRLRLVGDGLVCLQRLGNDRVFHAPSAAEPEWRLFEVDGQAVLAFERFGSGLAVLLADGRLAVTNEDLELEQASVQRIADLPGPLLSFARLTVGADKVAYLDDGAVYLLENGALRRQPLFYGEGRGSWEFLNIDRGRDGVLWALSKQRYLCRSDDDARTWKRVVRLEEGWRQLSVLYGGDVLIKGRRNAWRWRVGEQRLESVAAFEGRVLGGIERRGRSMLAYGWIHSDEVLVHLHIEPGGPNVVGILMGSTDGGETWHDLHRWPGGRITSVHWSDDDRLSVLNGAGGLRQGRLRVDAGVPSVNLETIVEIGEDDVSKAMYGGRTVHFHAPDEGWVEAQRYMTKVLSVTEDGGRTWHDSELDRIPQRDPVRLANGRRVFRWLASGRDDPDYLVEWKPGTWFRDGRFEELRRFGSNVKWPRADAAGHLLVLLRNGDLWSSETGDDWKRLATDLGEK